MVEQHGFASTGVPPTTVLGVAVHLPARAVPVDDPRTAPGLSRLRARALRRVHGFGEIRLSPTEDLFDLLMPAARAVLDDVADLDTVRYVISTHTALAVTPWRRCAPEEIRDRLGLVRAEPFAVTQQHCAGGLTALDIAGELLRSEGDPAARVLLVIGERRLPTLAGVIAHTTAIGEAAVACLVGLGGSGPRVLSYADRTVSLRSEQAWLTAESEREFNDGYVAHLAGVVDEAVRRAGTELSRLSVVIPHNVSRLLWSRTCAALGLDPRRVYLDSVARYGHCYCADPFVNLAALLRQRRLRPGDRYLLTAVGLGTTYAAMVLEHPPDPVDAHRTSMFVAHAEEEL